MTNYHRIAFIGDIGGHSEELYAALVGLGADPETCVLPDDLTVIQVGDLVHRGPDSHGVLDMVEKQLDTGQWVQLVGNHDLNEIDEPLFDFEVLDVEDSERLKWWRDTMKLRAAAAVETEDGDVLATHAGLTTGYHTLLGRPETALETAEALDALLHGTYEDLMKLSRYGMVLASSRSPDFTAGPIWAADGHEVCASWTRPMPFHQVHGHSTMYHWSKHTFSAPQKVADATALDYPKRHTITSVGDKKIWGIDPGLGRYAGCRWEPLVLQGRMLYPEFPP